MVVAMVGFGLFGLAPECKCYVDSSACVVKGTSSKLESGSSYFLSKKKSKFFHQF